MKVFYHYFELSAVRTLINIYIYWIEYEQKQLIPVCKIGYHRKSDIEKRLNNPKWFITQYFSDRWGSIVIKLGTPTTKIASSWGLSVINRTQSGYNSHI